MIDNNELIELFWNRDESAIKLIDKNYGRLYRQIALNITGNAEDAEECVNDAYNAIWNRIPPDKPDIVYIYILRIVRNISLNKRRHNTVSKRDSNEIIPIDSVEELLSEDESEPDPEQLKIALNDFLSSLDKSDRVIFVKRYWLEYGIDSIAKENGLTENNTRVRLFRIKNKLAKFLKKRGIDL